MASSLAICYLAFIVSLALSIQPSTVTAQDTSQALWDVTWKTTTTTTSSNSSTRINDLVLSMTLQEKIRHVHHFWNAGTQDFAAYLNVTARLGIPPIQLADGEACVSCILVFIFPSLELRRPARGISLVMLTLGYSPAKMV